MTNATPRAAAAPRHPAGSRPWIAVAALVVGVAYLAWRVTATAHGAHRGLFWALLVAETYGWLRLLLRTIVVWSVDQPAAPGLTQLRSTDVVVTAFAEPNESVRATLLGCRRIAHPHTTWLVDEAHREDLRALADELGVRYVVRRDRSDARTGAINHALTLSQAELIVLLNADQIPMPDLLHRTAGYFDDPDVAVVQTPIEFANRDSLLHSDHSVHERSHVNEIVNPGRDGNDAAVWDGAGAVLRREAFISIGGVPTGGTTGELQATVRLQGSGWKIRYHPQAVAQGLAPHNLDAFLNQRARWARGHLALIASRDNPVVARGLHLRQRVSHIELLSEYLAAPFHLAMGIVLIATLLTAQLPLVVDLVDFATFFVPWGVLASSAWVALGRGRVQFGETAIRHAVTLQIHLVAIIAATLGNKRRFTPVARDGVDRGGFDVLKRLQLLALLTLALEASIAVRLLDSLIGWPLPTGVSGAPLVAMVGVGSTVLWFTLRVLGVFVRRRQHRGEYRTDVSLTALGNGHHVKVTDLTPSGIGLVTTEIRRTGETIDVELWLTQVDGTVASVHAVGLVRSVLPNQDSTRWRVGCQFVTIDAAARDAIIEYTRIVRPFQELRTSGAAEAIAA